MLISKEKKGKVGVVLGEGGRGRLALFGRVKI